MKFAATVARTLLIAGFVLASVQDAAAQKAETAPSATAKTVVGKPRPPQGVTVSDHPWDGGDAIDVTFQLSPDDVAEAKSPKVLHYLVQRAGEYGGKYDDALSIKPKKKDYKKGAMTVTIDGHRGEEYYFRVRAVGPGDVESDPAETTEAAVAKRQWFDGGRFFLALITLVLCGAVVWYIRHARKGKSLYIRKIAGLEAINEAVGRATEMGRPCLFIPGIQDMNDIQTIAGLTVLSHVAQVAAEYDAKVEVPTSKALVMTTARETVQAAFLTAGRPDAYNEDLIYYVTDEQFGYVAYLSGMMVREKPAACFYMGAFFAESLILAETGNSIGAIQVAGTAMPSQLPFFVAACDYTLIGEEFFAASAYLSGDADQLASLKGQDVGKLIVAVLLLIGCGLMTLSSVTGVEVFDSAAVFLTDTVLK